MYYIPLYLYSEDTIAILITIVNQVNQYSYPLPPNSKLTDPHGTSPSSSPSAAPVRRPAGHKAWRSAP